MKESRVSREEEKGVWSWSKVELMKEPGRRVKESSWSREEVAKESRVEAGNTYVLLGSQE